MSSSSVLSAEAVANIAKVYTDTDTFNNINVINKLTGNLTGNVTGKLTSPNGIYNNI